MPPKRLLPNSDFFSASKSYCRGHFSLAAEAASKTNKENTPRAWRVDNLVSGAIYRCKNEEHALTLIEYATVQALVDRVKDSHRDSSVARPDAIFALHGALLYKDGFGVIVVGPAKRENLLCRALCGKTAGRF